MSSMQELEKLQAYINHLHMYLAFKLADVQKAWTKLFGVWNESHEILCSYTTLAKSSLILHIFAKQTATKT